MKDQFDLFASQLVDPNASIAQGSTPQPPRFSKSTYNQQHYLKNKSKILNEAKNRYRAKKNLGNTVIPLFESQDLSPPLLPPSKGKSKRKWFRMGWSTLFLQVFVGANSYFLVSESAKFYAQSDSSTYGPILKALLLDGAVLAFSLMKSRTTLARLFQRLMIAAIYAYTVWAVSGGVFHSSSLEKNVSILNQKTMMELESEITKSVRLRDAYFDSNKTTLAMRLNQSIRDLQSKLELSRKRAGVIPDPEVIRNDLLSLIVFRVLVMISNLFCLAELGRRYRTSARRV